MYPVLSSSACLSQAGFHHRRQERVVSARSRVGFRALRSTSFSRFQRDNRCRLQVKAFSLPNLVPILARALTAGVLFYATMNWVYYRGTRKTVDKAIEDRQEQQKRQKEKLARLNGEEADQCESE